MKARSRALAAVGAIAALASTSATAAQAGGWTGEWRGEARIGWAMMLVDLVIQPNGTFSETERTGSVMTMQTGVVKLPAAGEIAFVVVDWRPRTMPVYHAVGTSGGYYTQTPTTRPPGGIWRYRFTNADTVVMQDMNMGGSITLTRVR